MEVGVTFIFMNSVLGRVRVLLDFSIYSFLKYGFELFCFVFNLRGKAKQNYLVLPCSESDCSYQLRETDVSGISPAPGVSCFALEYSSLGKLAFPDALFCHSLSIATSGATWLPP